MEGTELTFAVQIEPGEDHRRPERRVTGREHLLIHLPQRHVVPEHVVHREQAPERKWPREGKEQCGAARARQPGQAGREQGYDYAPKMRAVLAASFAFGLAASWLRWTNPVIDSGREMNQPLRLAHGETLYSTVGHIYGPVSPWLHAILFRVFGPSLTILYADGIVCAIAILALVYWLARRVMDPLPAATGTLTVMWLCAFKPAGNFIAPYAYSALHGTLLGLAALALSVRALERPSIARFAAAGLLAGVTLLTKTEMGLSAVCAALVAAALAESSGRQRVQFAATALLVSLGVAFAVYTEIAARVGWRVLVDDSWLLVYNLPQPLRYFNRGISGFDHPMASLARMVTAVVKLGILAAIVGSSSYLIAGPRADAPRARLILGAALAAGVVLSLTTGLDWDRGPFLAMPFVLAVILVLRGRIVRDRVVIVYAAFALAQLARILLHVRSGGAYGSFLLPMSIVVFTYLWVGPFAGSLGDPSARRLAALLAIGLLIAADAGTAVVLAQRYRYSNTAEISTARGKLIVPPDVASVWNQALAFIDSRTHPDDPIAVLPEGTSLTFLSGRRNPLREEIVTPGFLDAAGEERAIRQIDDNSTPLVLIVNRPTREFGAEAFGRDYDRTLMAWIESRYRPCATFGPSGLEVGNARFFVRAYCRAGAES
jgi:hypothetical protein